MSEELQTMQKNGSTTEAMAQHAYQFRRAERLKARQQMRENGDQASVGLLEARDAKKYGTRNIGDKDGPNFEGLQLDAAAKLKAEFGRDPTRDEVFEHIIKSATRTDVKTNILFLTF